MFSEGINKPADPLFYRASNEEKPCSGHGTQFKEQFAEVHAEVAACCFSISPKQFSHRLAPAYLANTKIVRIDSLQSTQHWISLISLWISGKALFLPHTISNKHLEALLLILKQYEKALIRISNTSVDTCRESAQETIQEILTGLAQRDVFYTPLGYTASTTGPGHAIPLKLRNKGRQVETHFLNLGAGVHMHPIVDWCPSGPRYHFQSFPVLIDKTKLDSSVGEEVFARLVRLDTEECFVKVRGYSAEDVYGPICSLGTIQSSFNSKVDERSRKTQLGDICGDMAIFLIIKDVLIDFRYKKNELQRLVTLEKLCDILFFYHSLCSKESPLDEWILLKNGLKEFSVRALKEKESALSLSEIEFLHTLLHPLFAHTTEQISKLRKILLPITPLDEPQRVATVRAVPKQETFSLPVEEENLEKKSAITPSITSGTPAEIGIVLKEWVKVTEELTQKKEGVKAHHFVYRALCSLEIPTPDLEKQGFWDQVSHEEIKEVLEALTLLVCFGVDKNLSEDQGLIYRNELILSIAYTITDRLARRKVPELKGFASPFYPSRFRLAYTGTTIDKGKKDIYRKKDYFEFWNLPLGRANTLWSQVRIYFERQLYGSEHTLFALDQGDISIEQGVKDFHSHRFENRAWTSVQHHLKFLENFLEKSFPENSTLSLAERYKQLWMNPHHRHIPSEIETLYFFAYHAWHSFSNNSVALLPDFIPSSRVLLTVQVPREECKIECGIQVKQPAALKSAEIQSLLEKEEPFLEQLWKAAPRFSENEIQCLTYSGDHPGWNTQLTRQWARIFWKRSLQISSLIQWMRSNLSLICKREIQRLVEVALFMPGVLTAKIEEEPTTLIQLRELIGEAMVYYSKGSLENPTSLFLLRLGMVIESYAPKPLLEVYEARLLENIRASSNPSSFYYHLLFLYQIALPRGGYSIRELIKAQFWMAYHEVDSSEVPPWIVAETHSPLERYYETTLKCFQEQEWLEQTFIEVAGSIMVLCKPRSACKGVYPKITRGDKEIDVEMLRISSGYAINTLKFPYQSLIYIEKKYQDLFPALKEKKGLVWSTIDEGHFSCESERHRIEHRRNICLIGQKFPHLNIPGFFNSWYEKGGINSKASNSILFDSALYDHWNTKYATVICKKGEDRPLYFVNNPPSGDCFVHKVLPDGTLGPRLVFLEKNHPLTPWFKRLGDTREVCVWINEVTGYIEEIDFLVLGLTFQKEEGRFYCKNYPGFFLAEDQSLEELNFFEGALVLRNEKEKIVLIPARKLEQQGENFSTYVYFTKEFMSTHEKYFLYHLDEIAGLLVHPTSEGNLFLFLMFAMQMNYNQALFYLARSRSFSSPQESFNWLFLFFTHFKDQSPEALGFYLRLGLHIIHSTQQVILSAYDKKEKLDEEKIINFCKWLAEKFAKYLNIHSIKGVSRIPEEIQLSREEELFLLKYLEDRLKKEDPLENKEGERPKTSWSTLFDIRLSLLHKKTWSRQISPKSHQLYIANHLFSTEKWDLKALFKQVPPHLAPFSVTKLICRKFHGFIRLTLENISTYFMVFYERARTGQAEIDLFYLGRSNDFGFSYLAVYHLLLSYVHKHPATFQDLVFGEDPLQNEKIFEEILSRTDNISMKLWRSDHVQKSFLEDAIFFRYQKSIKLSLDTPPILAPIAWSISESKIGVLRELQTSILSYFQEYWFETSSNHGKTIYKLKEGKEVQECLCEAKKWLDAKRSEGLCLKKTAEAIANKYPEKDYFFGLRKMSSNLPEITMEGILTQAYQERNALKIKEANPSLKPQIIKELIFHTIHYHILRLLAYKLDQAIEALEKRGSIQEFAECLVSYGTFNPAENPEIFLYQSRTGKTLRKGQAELLEWELATTVEKIPKVRLFAAPAGDGKTTLYIPIAMRRFQRLGYIPLSFSSKPLYLVDREGLKETSQHVYSLELAVCEIALNSEAKAADYKWIYEQLTLDEGKKGFKLVPDTFYALHLKYQLALENGDYESVRWLSQIFAFWEKKGIAMIDESRLNCSPFTRSKIGIGKPIPLPEIDIVVFLEIYRFLIDENLQLPNNRSVKETVGLQKNQQATMSDKEREEVKKVVLGALVKSRLFCITPTVQSKLYKYWMNSSKKVDFLRGIEVEQRRAIDLVKIYFEEFFDKAMQLIWRMQHVRSIRPGEELHVPARARQATRAYFEEAYVTLIATIHGFLQEGLDGEQVKKLIIEAENRIIEEVGLSGKTSDTERMVIRWTGKDPDSLNRISISELAEDKNFYMRVRHHPEVIFWYLEKVVLKQIRSSPQQLTVTPVHMQNGFCGTTFFSADTGPKQIYGIYEDGQHVRTNSTFLEDVEQQFLSPKNSQFLTLPFLTRPLDCFHALLDQDPKLFSHLRMICDAGGTLRNFTAEEIVSDFFTLLNAEKQIDLDGVIIFEEASNKESETELLLWLKTWSKPQVIKGHDVPKALQALGLNWETLKLLTFIDPSHRAGANIEQPKGSSILILLGEGLTFSDLAQSALRDRGFLTGEKRLIWAAETRLVQLISDQISIPKVLTWTKSNGTKVAHQEVSLSTYQQIDYHIALPVWNAIKKKLEDPQAQIDLWRQYEKGLVMPTENDPIKRFKRKQKPQSLLEYAEEKYNSFGFSTPWKKATSLHIKLRPFIATQSHMLSPSSFDVMRHTHVYTHQKEEMQKEFIALHELTSEPYRPLPEGLSIDKDNFITQMCKHSTQASQVFNSKGLTDGLLLTPNALHTAKSGTASLGENYLKLIQYILVVQQNGKWIAFGLSDEEAFELQKQICSLETPFFQKCALVGGDGFLVQNGKKRCALSPEEMQINFIQDVVTDIGLTRCELVNPLRFMKRIPTWHDFWRMWLKMKTSQPFPYSTLMVEKHVPPPIRNYVPSKPPSFADSFLKSFFG